MQKDLSKAAKGKISGGHFLARAIKAKGIDQIFTLCGGFTNPLLIGCLDYEIDVVAARNEMEAGFLAAATARFKREVAVCVAEPSGFTNYISAVAEAHYAGDPVIFIGVSSNTHHFDNQGFKELPQAEVVRSMTKYSIEVNEAQRMPWFFDKAFDIASNHPTGPVQLTIPINFLFTAQIDDKSESGIRTFDTARRKVHRPWPNPADLEEAVTLLNQAQKPIIISGQDAWHSGAEEDVMDFATKKNIPVFTPFTHLKSVDVTHPMHMGLLEYHQNPCSRLVSDECDVILMLGEKLAFPLNQGSAPLFNPATTLVSVNATSRELSNNMLADVRIASDIKGFLEALDKNGDINPKDETWVQSIRRSRKTSVEDYRETLRTDVAPIHPLRLCVEVLKTLGEDDILVLDGGDIACWAEIAINFWAFEGHQIGGVFAPGPWEQMGTGPAFATAIQMAAPTANVVLITGDGSLGLAPGFTPMETAIDRKVNVTMIVANNAQWGMIREQQTAMWGREIATQLRDVEYHRIFDAAGAFSQLVACPTEINSAVSQAIAHEGPSFIEAKTQGVASPITQGLIEMRVKTAIE